jgi:hypothetical protein
MVDTNPTGRVFFDLQRFSDGVQADAPTPAVQADTPTEYTIALDENRRVVRIPAEKPVEVKEEPKEEIKQEQQQTEVEEQEQVANDPPVVDYTPEEVASADLTTLDPKRIPDALKPLYKAMVAGMNKKFQEVAHERKTIDQLTEELKKTIQQPREPQPSVKDHYAREHAQVVADVERLFNLQAGELLPDPTLWEPEQRIAYDDIRAYKRDQLRQQNEQRQKLTQQEQAAVKFANDMEGRYRKLDSEAYELIMDKYNSKKLTVEEKEAIDTALTTQDQKALDDIFDRHRKTLRKVPDKRIEKPKPPVLETGGTGKQPQVQAFNYDKFRTASQSDKVKMIAEWRKNGG